ncbi:MAG: hypothetical protein NUW23_02315 [Firmicutes bacterium]|jgi:hypothetical protein|nr:hypothetical protein [Bacillota bacterium]
MKRVKHNIARVEQPKARPYDPRATFERLALLTAGISYEIAYAKKRLMADERARAKAAGLRWEQSGPVSSTATFLSDPRGVIFRLGSVPPSVNDAFQPAIKGEPRIWTVVQDWWFDEIMMALCHAEPSDKRNILPLRRPAAVVLQYNMTGRTRDMNNYMVEKAILDALVYAGVIVDDSARRVPVIGHIEQFRSSGTVPSIDLAVLEEEESVQQLIARYKSYFGRARHLTSVGHRSQTARRAGPTIGDNREMYEMYRPAWTDKHRAEEGEGQNSIPGQE